MGNSKKDEITLKGIKPSQYLCVFCLIYVESLKFFTFQKLSEKIFLIYSSFYFLFYSFLLLLLPEL